MGQFDLQTDAALAQLNWEELSKTPGGEFVEIIGDLISLSGVAGSLAVAGGASNLLLKVRRLAGASYATNLIYVITAVRDDLRALYESREELRGRVTSLPTDPKFAEAISALALRAMQTSVKDRLKRLARIVVNGVKEDDLEPESLDDMMCAAVELKEEDIVLLGKIFGKQMGLMRDGRFLSSEWSQQIGYGWVRDFAWLDSQQHLAYRASLARLRSTGLITQVETNIARNGLVAHQPFGLLPEGKKFYERLQEIAIEK